MLNKSCTNTACDSNIRGICHKGLLGGTLFAVIIKVLLIISEFIGLAMALISLILAITQGNDAEHNYFAAALISIAIGVVLLLTYIIYTNMPSRKSECL